MGRLQSMHRYEADGIEVKEIKETMAYGFKSHYRLSNLKKLTAISVASTTLLMLGCGGGNNNSTSSVSSNLPPANTAVVSTNTYDFQTGWRAFLQSSYTKNLNVSGSCSGSLTYKHSPTSQPKEFYYSDLSFPHPYGTASPGYVVSQVQQMEATLKGCSIVSLVSTNTAYFDGLTFAPFGYNGGTAYNGATSYKATFREFSNTVVLPSLVKVGDNGIVGTSIIYGISNFKKDGIQQGRYDVTYLVEPDTASTAIINITSKGYDANNVMTVIDQTRYLLDTSNKITLHSIEQQTYDGSKLTIIAK